MKLQPSQTAGESDHQNVHNYNTLQSTECSLSFVWILCRNKAKAKATQAWLAGTSGNVDIVIMVIDFGLLGRQAEEAHHGAWLQGFWEKS